MIIPFFDLKRQLNMIQPELDAAMRSVIDSGQFLHGAKVAYFEQQWSAYLGVEDALGVGNGTDAIYVLLRALGISGGDEVITTALSWVSSASAIAQTGANVVFTEVDDRALLDLDQLEQVITPKTKALLLVHLYGQMVDVQKARAFCDKQGIYLIEDAAQAHGASFDGEKVGAVSDAAVFSFYPTKNLGALGDAGAIVSRNVELLQLCRKLANQGGLLKHEHELIGVTSRMDELQAAILSVKLKYLDSWNERRREIAAFYFQELGQIEGLSFPLVHAKAEHVFHQFVVLTDRRDELRTYLGSKGIGTDVHYPVPLPLLPVFRSLGYQEGDFPNVEKFSKQGLSLPIYPELTEEELIYICREIRAFFRTRN